MKNLFNAKTKTFATEGVSLLTLDDFSSLNRILYELELLAREWRAFASVVNRY